MNMNTTSDNRLVNLLAVETLEIPTGIRTAINEAYYADERNIMEKLLNLAILPKVQLMLIGEQAKVFIDKIRSLVQGNSDVNAFFSHYALDSAEGIALLCLSEALLRIPDSKTVDLLIKDKLGSVNWSADGFGDYNAQVLRLTSKILTPENANTVLTRALLKITRSFSAKIIQTAIKKATSIISKQFVGGNNINEALINAQKMSDYRFSYDLLGEAALTMDDAQRYFAAYKNAIEVVGTKLGKNNSNIYQNPGISVKLSALHPRYEEAQRLRVLNELTPKLLNLAQITKRFNISLTIDAEESERLELSLDVIEQVFTDHSLNDWHGFGVAVQTYQKRALPLLDWLADLARIRPLMVRLLKGAYWDSEIKKAQMQGRREFPVFTYKAFTDVSFQVCAQKLLSCCPQIYPQFATHNAYSVAMILNLVGNYRGFEFQRLYGMGAELYDQIVSSTNLNIPCRIYAPVGKYQDLLPYLVRRLLENGANSSFVNNLSNLNIPIEDLILDPVAQAYSLLDQINKYISLPTDLFLPARKNSPSFDFNDRKAVAILQKYYRDLPIANWQAFPILAKQYKRDVHKNNGAYVESRCPQNTNLIIGAVRYATKEEISAALITAADAFVVWSAIHVEKRAVLVNNFAYLLSKNTAILLKMLCLEAGKCWNDANAEIREAIDYCYYYVKQAIKLMAKPTELQGYTGESNELSLHPRGIVLAISPWNFPLAIFSGQIIAALMTGNCVIAKPAEQATLIAAFTIQLMLQAGIMPGVVQLLPGRGEEVGQELIKDQRIKAVVFTGGMGTAQQINQTLASRGGEIIPLIAETGGQNAMIVDSSALLEQVIPDVVASAFGSAGQRCSALRVLYVQTEIYASFIKMLKGAMRELCIGDSRWLKVDLSSLIDNDALMQAKRHVVKMGEQYEIVYQSELDASCQNGFFMPPTVIAIPNIAALKQEIFAPILHVIAYKSSALNQVITQINSTGCGLTLGIHSRVNQTIDFIRKQVHVGNCYVNRNMIGAVVGLQPFGGEGLSGTGPKAGGPHYLSRFCLERTYTINTTAAGGNASLLSAQNNI